ncbi:MAG: hypothetical protein C5B48_08385 [Candidatus Rokuibacteriota bacterium]|nr:MAG: hypothetical protein C5B48_08385 [Candidatus Rokubacteria bacterium]
MKVGRVDIGGGVGADAVTISSSSFGRSVAYGGELRVFCPAGADVRVAMGAVESWRRKGYDVTLWKQCDVDASASAGKRGRWPRSGRLRAKKEG